MPEMRCVQSGGIELNLIGCAREKVAHGVRGFIPDSEPAIGRCPHAEDMIPGAQALQITLAACAQCGYADIGSGLWVEFGGRCAINHRNTEAFPPEAGGKCGADHAGTDNYNIKSLSHIGFLSDAPQFTRWQRTDKRPESSWPLEKVLSSHASCCCCCSEASSGLGWRLFSQAGL